MGNLYLVPKTGAGTLASPYQPKYSDQISVAGFSWAALDSSISAMLMYSPDISAALDTTITANADCYKIMFGAAHAAIVPASIASLNLRLIALGIPVQATAVSTWENILNKIITYFQAPLASQTVLLQNLSISSSAISEGAVAV